MVNGNNKSKTLYYLKEDLFCLNKALIQTFPYNFITLYNLCDFTIREHKFCRKFCAQRPILNVCFKDFWYTKINPTQIWSYKIN